MAAGTVESSTSSSGQPFCGPNVRRKTSGHKLEPPMPSTTTCIYPALRISSAKAFSSTACSCTRSATCSHPSAFLKMVCCGGQLLHGLLGIADIFFQAEPWTAVIAESVEGLGRNRVNRLWPDEFFHVNHVAILGIFRAGGSPELPLRHGSLRAQLGKTLAME